MSIPQVLAVLYALVTGLVTAFQVALALGAPWGAYAMGGGFPGRMPRPLRVAAFVQAILLAALALIVLASVGNGECGTGRGLAVADLAAGGRLWLWRWRSTP